ncbi:sigma-54-dependent Fis family transcriptional regulator [Sphingobacteriales bacterium UPWRP_1]|nr:regulator [Sphingobacteriales bacterium TSM_CSM]PSJ74380.1 sigma-54-dependent Fis family transcriptional regulator [Sphingobacteriales bacterium UPWRP_1]
MKNYCIFIVEDDAWYGQLLEYQLSLNPDYEIHRFTTAKDCLAQIYRKPNLITIDYSLPDMNGEKLFREVKNQLPDVPVIIISGQEDIGTAVGLLKMGVYDYIVKDENTKDLLWNSVIKARETAVLKQEVEELKQQLTQKYEFENIIKGNSSAVKQVFTLMEKAIRTNINVSVSGETGTGKELVARAIHFNSDRRKQPFVAVNMAAIPHELLESELFGHEKGAFTGAIARKIGKFEEANKGTLFLDEIAELDINLQSKLLRVLQERELVRIGGNEKVKLDVRLITASHKNLAQEVKSGNFREDLYYRIIGLPIELPPLRDRENDVLILAKYFLDEFCRDNKMPAIAISPQAKEKLRNYYYPGNVRELKAIIDLAAVMCNGKELLPDDITFTALKSNEFLMSDEKTLRQYTVLIIEHFLKKYDHNVVKVAEKLDIGKSTIYKMIQDKEITI